MTARLRGRLASVCGRGAAGLWLGGWVVCASAAGLSIQRPGPGENVRDNRGDLAVSVAIEDNAQLPEGFAIRILLDGKPAAPDGPITRIPLTGVDRGTHELQALIVDGSGHTVARSAPRTFTMRQASRLNRARAQ